MTFQGVLAILRKAVFVIFDEYGERCSDYKIIRLVPRIYGQGKFSGTDFAAESDV